MSEKKKPDWRAKGKQGAPRPGSEKRGAGWARKPTPQHETAKLWFRVRMGLWTLALTGMITAFVVWLIYRPTWTPMLTVGVVDYGVEAFTLVPPNSLAKEDLDRLEGTLGNARIVNYSKVDYASWESGETGLKTLRQAIEKAEAKPGGPGGATIIVYLSMHGVVNEDGEPCLLPPDASPLDSSQWTPLEVALRYLFPEGSSGKKPVNRLLLLDCNRMDANWSMGLLYNGFADGLDDVLARVDIPGLVVINSTSPGEIGWTAPNQLGGSVFGFFVSEGLRGAADNTNEGGDGNKKVSLMEFYTYLKTQVNEWVQENRNDQQTPLLVRRKEDNFGLVFAQSDQATSFPSAGKEKDPRWKEVEKYWLKFPESTHRATLRFNPLVWAEFQRKLLRLEDLILAGKAYEDQYKRTRKELDDLTDQLSVEGFDGSLNRSEPEVLSRRLSAHSLPLTQVRAAVGARGSSENLALDAWEKLKTDPSGASWPRPPDSLGDAALVEIHFAQMLQTHLDEEFWRANPQRVGAALALSRLAEQAAAPMDERTQYWVESLVDAADQRRRTVENRLFVGASDLPAEEEFARSNYDEAIALSEEIHAAYQWRDTARAITPAMGQWLLARLHNSKARQLEDLDALIQDTHQLDAELDISLAAGESSRGLKAATASVQQGLEKLEKVFFEQECDDLVTAGADQHTLKRISVVLDVPLLVGKNRNRLREKYLQIARAGGEAPAAAQTQSDQAASDYLERLARPDKQHPALAILDRSHLEAVAESGGETRRSFPKPPDKGDEPTEAVKAWRLKLLAQQGESVRRLLESAANTADELIQVTDRRLGKKLDERYQETPAEARKGVGSADRLVRAAAELVDWSNSPWEYPADDPTHRLRYFDYHQLMIWHAQRAIDDFWGPNPSDEGAGPYFQIAAEGYLKSARNLWPGANVLRRKDLDLPTLLDARRRAARDGIVLDPSHIDIDEDQQAGTLELLVMPPADVPDGEAALFVRDLDGQPISLSTGPNESDPMVRRLDADLINGRQVPPRQALIPKSNMPNDSGRLEVASLYRGHMSTALFTWQRTDAGIPIRYAQPDYPDPNVTVHGAITKGHSVVFVLDYSGSMNREMEVVIDNKTTQRKRYIEARHVLGEILQRLVKRDNPYHVGLLVYGHRVGWETSAANPNDYDTVVWDPNDSTHERTILRPHDNNLHPRDDVEDFLPLGAFEQFDYEVVMERLKDLRPLGETPLYYSIVQAVDVLKRRLQTPKGHVIVITDGVNQRTDEDVYVSDVDVALKSLGKDKLRLDVIGFELSREAIKQQIASLANPNNRQEEIDKGLKSFDDLNKYARQSGGDYHEAAGPDGLLKALRDLLQLSQYKVLRSGDGRPATEDPVELGQTAVIEQLNDVRVDYTVRLASEEERAEADIELEGGEAIQLFVSEDRGRLIHKRYETHARDFRDGLLNPLDPSGEKFYLCTHIPQWKGNAVEFYVSVQNHDPDLFSRRPAEAWIQIRPKHDGDTTEVADYIFYDLKFESNRPVPVIGCLAPSWPWPPNEASKAEIRLWVKMEKTDPGERNIFPVSDSAAGVSFEIDGLPGVFKIEPDRRPQGAQYQVVVTETHTPTSTLDHVKVEMFPPPKQVTHRFNRKTATVRHTFKFDDSVADRIGEYSVIFTAHDDIARDAITLSEPLIVDIPKR